MLLIREFTYLVNYLKMIFMKTKINLLALTIGVFFCFSCHTSNERPTICGRLVQVYYNLNSATI